MKLILATVCICFGALTLNSYGQKIAVPAASPLEIRTQKFGLGEVSIEYSRPAVKGRKIFGNLVPYGSIWRTGANATTKITFSDEVKFSTTTIQPGTYGIYTIPGVKSWSVMLYKDTKLGGNVQAYNKADELLRVEVPVEKLSQKVESLTIGLSAVNPTTAMLTISWEKTMVSVPLTTEIDARVMQSIEANMKTDKPAYFTAAKYYLENNKDLKQALTWADLAFKENPEAYYILYVKAVIEYKLNDKVAGKTSADKTVELAKAAKNEEYVKKALQLIEENK